MANSNLCMQPFPLLSFRATSTILSFFTFDAYILAFVDIGLLSDLEPTKDESQWYVRGRQKV